ncbi:MAG TPA: hypothetical protein VNN76_05505 [Bacteroidota bacterium]|nr:hypothetical protein [Bacteroidota bacterium]
MKSTIPAVLLCLFTSTSLMAQVSRAKDSTIIFQPAKPDLFQKNAYAPLRNAWGFDIMLSNNGFAGGFFLRKELSDDFAGSLSLAISDVKDEAEVEYYDQFTGQSFIPGKKNRLLLVPLILSIQYRLFREDIVDNFRPYVTAGLGPSMVYVAPYIFVRTEDLDNGQTYTYAEQVEFFTSLKYGRPRYTLGGFIGAGAYFGLDRGSLSGISVRYYIVPFRDGIEVLHGGYIETFGGFYITLNFGSLY